MEGFLETRVEQLGTLSVLVGNFRKRPVQCAGTARLDTFGDNRRQSCVHQEGKKHYGGHRWISRIQKHLPGIYDMGQRGQRVKLSSRSRRNMCSLI